MLSHFSHVALFATPWIIAHQAALPMGFSRQEYWSGLPCLPPRDLLNQGMEFTFPASPLLQGGWFTVEPLGKHLSTAKYKRKYLYVIGLERGFPGCSAGKEFSCKVGDLGSIPGLGRFLGEGKGYPLWYSGLEKPMDCIYSPWSHKESTKLSNFHLLTLGLERGRKSDPWGPD